MSDYGQQPGWGQPPGGMVPSGYGQAPVLVTMGEISCTQVGVIVPQGHYPIRGTTWVVRDQSTQTEKIPSYAIILAIVFALLCLVGLLFLLIKERKTQGYVEVAVQGNGLYHATQIPVSSPEQVTHIRQMVDYARGLAAAA